MGQNFTSRGGPRTPYVKKPRSRPHPHTPLSRVGCTTGPPPLSGGARSSLLFLLSPTLGGSGHLGSGWGGWASVALALSPILGGLVSLSHCFPFFFWFSAAGVGSRSPLPLYLNYTPNRPAVNRRPILFSRFFPSPSLGGPGSGYDDFLDCSDFSDFSDFVDCSVPLSGGGPIIATLPTLATLPVAPTLATLPILPPYPLSRGPLSAARGSRFKCLIMRHFHI